MAWATFWAIFFQTHLVALAKKTLQKSSIVEIELKWNNKSYHSRQSSE
jgi:hypothetical protein